MEDWKIKIAVLWSLFEFCMITVSIVGQDMPGFMPETAEMRLVLAVSLLIPPIMAFLSLILKDSVNRWVKIILSIILIAMAYPFGLAEATADYFGSMLTVMIVEVVALLLIVWYAWKSKQEARAEYLFNSCYCVLSPCLFLFALVFTIDSFGFDLGLVGLNFNPNQIFWLILG